MKKSQKVLLISISIIVIILAIYLNRAYAYIYYKIGVEHLSGQNSQQSYMVGMSPLSTLYTYVAMGDSLAAGVGTDNISQSFPYLVAEKMSMKHGPVKLVDLGVPGAKSKDVLSSQLAPAIASNPDSVTILIGVNDIHDLISVSAFKNNISETISQLKKSTHAEIVLINLPYIGSSKLIYPPYNFYFKFRTWQYNRAIAEICASMQVRCVDLYNANLEHSKDENFYASDYFHPTAQGYLLWSNIIYAD